MMEQKVLDACCGSRMMWFDKNHQDAVFHDAREIETTLCDGRRFEIKPDFVGDFRDLQFADECFFLVVFDPPHLVKVGKKSWLAIKYGKLSDDWREDLKQGIRECFRVLKPNGTFVFKWNETQVPTRELMALFPYKPLIGHQSGKRSNTHWMVFLKEAA